MPILFLTPVSIGYLAQAIAAILISAYLIHRLRHTGQPVHSKLLAATFADFSFLFILLLAESVLSPTDRVFPVGLQNTFLGLALTLLIQFAYHFPGLLPQRKFEARIVLLLSLAYTAWEAAIAVWRFSQLAQAQVTVRPDFADYFPILGFIWVPLVLARQTVAFSEESGSRSPHRLADWLLRLLFPNGRAARAAGNLILVLVLPVVLNFLNLLRTFGLIPFFLYHGFLSIGILFTVLAFTLIYVNAQPESTSFVARLTASATISLLAITSFAAWLLSSQFSSGFQSSLNLDRRTLRFSPNQLGGYTVSEQPFSYEAQLGTRLDIRDSGLVSTDQKISFTFPYYGKTYTEIYVSNDGALIMGQPTNHYNIHFRYGQVPAIFAYYYDLDPEGSGLAGIYLRQQADRLTITWNHVPSFFHPESANTFQVSLFSDGIFEITYNGLPARMPYQPQNPPIESPWLVGVTPGGVWKGNPQGTDFGSLPIQSSSIGLLHDEYLSFRQYLHELLVPFLYLMLFGNLLFLIGLPLYLRSTLAQPLYRLLEGVRRMNQRELTAPLPISANDEIGYLTASFNAVNQELSNLIQNLELRVQQRTTELTQSNNRLQSEVSERQQAQHQVIQQQRTLAVLEERERLGRELHDNLGQVLAYVNMQSSTAVSKLDKGKLEDARKILNALTEVARQSHGDLRGFILGLKSTAQPSDGFWPSLQRFVTNLQHSSNMQISLACDPPWETQWLSPAGEINLLRIIQEALKNTHRHAQAKQAQVKISRSQDQLQVEINDDGIGFDPDSIDLTKNFGVQGMRERAAEISATLQIVSSSQQGTRILLECPILPQPPLPQMDLQPLRTLLVDDHPMFLEGLRNLLIANGIQVIGEAANGLEAIEKALDLRPDLIIMDLEMPECNGLEATRRIKSVWPASRIIILTVSASEQALFEALKAGASGYLLKNMNAYDFFITLSNLDQGAPPIAPELASLIENEFNRSTPGELSIQINLSPQQREILKLVSQGLTYSEVGQRLFLSESTIKYHMKQILDLLQLNSRAQAISYARRSGLAD